MFNLESDDELSFDRQKENYNESTDSRPLYHGAEVNVGAFMLLLAVFTTKYNLIGDACQQLLNIIAFALPNGHVLCTNLSEFKHFFKNLKNPLIEHYYCEKCLGYISDTSVTVCPQEFCCTG